MFQIIDLILRLFDDVRHFVIHWSTVVGRMLFDLLLMPFRWAGYAFWLLLRAFQWWWESRQLANLWWGLPALLVIALGITSVMAAKSTSRVDTAQKYVSAARVAAEKEDWHRSQLYYERAMELGIRDRENLFALATAAQQNGDITRMSAILDYLAPEGSAGYAPAHLWKATQILGKGTLTPVDVHQAEKQLRFALQQDPDLLMAHALLGDLYFQSGALNAAIEHLSRTHRTAVMYRLKLARAFSLRGETEKSRSTASLLIPYARAEQLENPRDVPARLNLSEAVLMSGDFEEAAKILVNGIRLEDDPALRTALTMVWIKFADELLQQNGQRENAFQILSAALENTPTEILLFDRLLKLLKSSDSGPATNQQVEEFLKANLVAGRAVGISHLVLGTYLFEKGEPQQAGFHLEQAFRLLPQGPVVANNLAWYLTKSETPDPTRALEIMDVLIKNYPESHEFRDTRGHVYLALEQWQDAAADFEKTLTVFANRPATHLALATAYENLDMTDISESHRKMAAQLANADTTTP